MADPTVPIERAGIAVETNLKEPLALSSPRLACYSERRIVLHDLVVILLILIIVFVRE